MSKVFESFLSEEIFHYQGISGLVPGERLSISFKGAFLIIRGTIDD